MEKISVGILITGNEILSFKTRDSNGPFMGMHLRKIGVPIHASMMCGDDEKDILDCLSYLSERCQVILMTGGLGPTSDDLTSEIVAKFFNLKTCFYEKAWENCLEAYKKFNRVSIPESNKKQAYLPEGSQILNNKIGTAVGFKVSGISHQKPISVYCMPGVPFEMEGMFLNEVLPELVSKSITPVSKVWQVFLMGESAMQSAIELAEKKLATNFPNSAISYQAHPGYVTYTVTLFPSTQEEKVQYTKYLEQDYSMAVQEGFHKNIIYSKDLHLTDYVIESYLNKQKTISFLECSCNGGLSKEISTNKNSEKVFNGSLIYQGKNIENKNEFYNVCHNFDKNLQLNSINTDILFKEWGAPHSDLSKQDTPFGQFYLVVSILKKSIMQLEKLKERFMQFDWLEENSFENFERIHFVYQLNISTRYDKIIQQRRVALHAMCILAMIADYI